MNIVKAVNDGRCALAGGLRCLRLFSDAPGQVPKNRRSPQRSPMALLFDATIKVPKSCARHSQIPWKGQAESLFFLTEQEGHQRLNSPQPDSMAGKPNEQTAFA